MNFPLEAFVSIPTCIGAIKLSAFSVSNQYELLASAAVISEIAHSRRSKMIPVLPEQPKFPFFIATPFLQPGYPTRGPSPTFGQRFSRGPDFLLNLFRKYRDGFVSPSCDGFTFFKDGFHVNFS